MTIQIDTREKERAVKKILAEFDRRNITHISSKLYVGDYMSFDNPRVIIDRKQNLLEICTNVCQQKKRFTAELARASQAGIKLIILCEHSKDIKTLDDVKQWINPRLKESPMAVSGERLYKILLSLKNRYNVEFEFCGKANTGSRIIELLSLPS